MTDKFVRILTNKPVRHFLIKFRCTHNVEKLVIISPFLSLLDDVSYNLEEVCKDTKKKDILFYLITKPPEDEKHYKAINILSKYNNIEIRYNDSLHAKLYIGLTNDINNDFAMLGSSNFTTNSIVNNIEIAMMIFSKGEGKKIIRELSKWGLEILRTRTNSKIVKKINTERN